MKIKPTISIPVITLRPSSAAFASSQAVMRASLTEPLRVSQQSGRHGGSRRLAAQPPRRRRPRLAVAVAVLGLQMRAGRDQVGKRRHRVELAGRGNADEPVGVEVVAEQDRLLGFGICEEPRPAVVDEVALVDRLEREREPLRRKRREDRRELALAVGQERPAPRAGSPRRPPPPASPRARAAAQEAKKSATASMVWSMCSSSCASETKRHSNWEGAT